jgi:transposase
MWLARLTENGLLRPSFVPPAQIRALRNYTRARTRLVQDRTRCWQRLEKLLEGALIKLSSQLSSLSRVKSARLILDALADGQRDPAALAALALGSLQGRRPDLEKSLEGMTAGAHHSRLIRIHLDHVTFLDRAISAIEDDIDAALQAVPAAGGVAADGTRCADPGPGALALPADARLAEIPGLTVDLARAIIAETGLDMSAFPTPDHLVSWAGLAPVARQSGPRTRKPGKGQGNSYLKGYCTAAANGAALTETFLGQRLRRLQRRIGGARARCAVGRSILVIIWHLLADPEARYIDLGADWHERKTDRDKKIRGHLRQLQALGLTVTVTDPTA